ncbi:hypothetical protein H1C71_039909, partial [Ictidomys tridecemlineatus]
FIRSSPPRTLCCSHKLRLSDGPGAHPGLHTLQARRPPWGPGHHSAVGPPEDQGDGAGWLLKVTASGTVLVPLPSPAASPLSPTWQQWRGLLKGEQLQGLTGSARLASPDRLLICP